MKCSRRWYNDGRLEQEINKSLLELGSLDPNFDWPRAIRAVYMLAALEPRIDYGFAKPGLYMKGSKRAGTVRFTPVKRLT